MAIKNAAQYQTGTRAITTTQPSTPHHAIYRDWTHMKFSDLGLIEPLLEAVKQKGYTTPSLIQQKAIPVILKGSDLMASAQTGTGKTGSYGIPIAADFLKKRIITL